MAEKLIIVNIQFNTHKYTDKRLTKEWIDERMGIFNSFTLQSLKNQTNQNFLSFINYDPSTEELVNKALSKYEALPSNIRFVPPSECKLSMADAMKDYDDLYLVRVDSDNLYHKSFIQQLHDYRPKEDTEALLCQKGYAYDSVKNNLGHYHQLSPPFYAYIYKTEDYLKGKRYKFSGGHGAVLTALKCEILEGRNYTVVIHSSNFSNSDRLLKGSTILAKEEAESILREFLG